MRALQHLVVGGQRQPALEQPAALRLVVVEVTHEHVDGGGLEVVGRELPLALAVDVAPGEARRPLQLERAVLALEEHGQPLGAVRDLGRHRVDVQPAELLEVGELRHLHPVQPDLPAEPPGAERRLLPVVLDEPRIVAAQVDAERLERAPVLVEHVVRARLEDHLELEVVLEAEGVLAVAAVGGPDHRLDVGGPPLAGAEAAQEGGRIHRPGGELGVVRLHDHAPALGPVRLERGQHVLVGWRGHGSGHRRGGFRFVPGRSSCAGGSRNRRSSATPCGAIRSAIRTSVRCGSTCRRPTRTTRPRPTRRST